MLAYFFMKEEFMNLKSERLRKLEKELEDLKQWLRLGLVPKKDIDKHKSEIQILEKKMNEEKSRLVYLKENGKMEEVIISKKPLGARQPFQDPNTMHDLANITTEDLTETEYEVDNTSHEADATFTEDSEEASPEDRTIYEEDDPFSDKNRWKRGVLENPDEDSW